MYKTLKTGHRIWKTDDHIHIRIPDGTIIGKGITIPVKELPTLIKHLQALHNGPVYGTPI